MQDISNVHPDATELTNDTDQLSPILSFSPESGLFFRILNMVQRGREEGLPIYFKLRDSSGNLLPVGTSVAFKFETPSDEQAHIVSEVRDNIQSWNNLSIRDQQEAEYVDSVKIPLKGRALTVRDIDTAFVVVDSTKQVDWDNSEMYIEGNAVTEAPKN